MTSIREHLPICKNSGGFSTVIRCVDTESIVAKVYRSGLPDGDVNFDLHPVEIKGDTFFFALPASFWSNPVGYYNFDLYHGERFIRTLRLELYHIAESGKTEVLPSVSECDNKDLPNIDLVVECDEECPVPDPCIPVTTRTSPC